MLTHSYKWLGSGVFARLLKARPAQRRTRPSSLNGVPVLGVPVLGAPVVEALESRVMLASETIVAPLNISATPGSPFNFDVRFKVENGAGNFVKTNFLELEICFTSSQLTLQSTDNFLTDGLQSGILEVQPDTDDLDHDPTTDRFASFLWDTGAQNAFPPDSAGNQPVTLFRANFVASAAFTGTTKINFAGSGAKDFDFVSTPVTVSAAIPTPSVSITSSAPILTSLSPIPVSVSFSSAVTGFTASDLVVSSGATVTNFTGTGANYTFDLNPSPTVQGTITVNIPANVTDGGNTAASQFSRTFDTLGPQFTSSATTTLVENTISAQLVIATDAHPAVTFALSNASVAANADVDQFSINGTTGQLSFRTAPKFATPTDANHDNVYLVQVIATDSLGNTSTQNLNITVTEISVVPDVSISSSTANLTSQSPIPVTVTFTSSVTGFTASDVVVVSGVISNFAGSGTTYTFDVTPAFQGSVAVSVPQNVVTGGNNPSSVLTREFDSMGPSFTSAGNATVLSGSTSATQITAIDVHPAVTYTLSEVSVAENADASQFALDATTGQLSFLTAPEFNAPSDANSDNIYLVQVVAADSLGNTTTQNISITVTDNTVRTTTITLVQTTLDYRLKSGPANPFSGATFTVTGPENPDFSKAILFYYAPSSPGRKQANARALQASSQLQLTKIISNNQFSESAIHFRGVEIGTVSIENNPSGYFIIDFNSAATTDAVEAVIRSLSYSQTKRKPVTGTLSLSYYGDRDQIVGSTDRARASVSVQVRRK